ncbi:MAG: trypsin-like serine protease [Bdellovibrionales bacterium]|nr:trypsin-like serine protease [Bdellovibrionales bacterium]
MKLFLYIGMTALVLTACSSRENVSNDESEIANAITSCDSGSSGIVNGTSVTAQDPDSKRAVLLIIHRGKIVTSCTGTPISDRVILTAGHCLKDVKKGDVDVVFNSDISCSAMANSIPSVDILIHKDYKGDNQAKFDLAMLKLESPIPSSYLPQSIYDGKAPLSNDQVLMIGYGVTSESIHDSMHLRKTTKSFKTETAIRDQNIGFDQRTGGGVCSGDSGGPVYVQVGGEYKIIAVNSTVMNKDESQACHGLSMAMYMPFFADWVQQSLDKLR